MPQGVMITSSDPEFLMDGDEDDMDLDSEEPIGQPRYCS